MAFLKTRELSEELYSYLKYDENNEKIKNIESKILQALKMSNEQDLPFDWCWELIEVK